MGEIRGETRIWGQAVLTHLKPWPQSKLRGDAPDIRSSFHNLCAYMALGDVEVNRGELPMQSLGAIHVFVSELFQNEGGLTVSTPNSRSASSAGRS